MANLSSIISEFYIREKTIPNVVYLKQPYGDTWKTITWGEVGQEARKLVTALRGLGYQKGDHIALISKNCYHWIITDIALMMGGYVSIPLYASLNSEELNTVLEISDAKMLIVGKLDEWSEMSKGVPADMPIIKFPHYDGNAVIDRGQEWDSILEGVAPMEGEPLPDMNDLWTILFTSGTTGTPKGVMLNHDIPARLLDNERKTSDIGIFDFVSPKYFSFLPLNHIAERIVVEVASIYTSGVISFAESLESFAKNLKATKPTVFFAVPRIWVKFQQAVFQKMPPEKLDKFLKIPLLSWYVKNKIKKAMGLNEAKLVLTAAAPTPDALKAWYLKLGLHLREIYGMTETCGGITYIPKDSRNLNSVGIKISNSELKVNPETGEVMAKSAWNMLGYYKEEEKTNEILRDGWIHTGDKGELDENGYLKIVGRVTDTFKSSKGKYIMPVPIEDKLIGHEYIEQICVVGLGQPQPMALVNLSDIGNEASKEEVTKELEQHLAEVNGKLDSYKKVSAIIIAKDQWTVASKLITPTLKVRRGFIHNQYAGMYEQWSDAKSKVIWE